jgi:caffeoyl-CoA O-methyltransferase
MTDKYEQLHQYAQAHSQFWATTTAEVLNGLERATHLRTLAAQMLSGGLQGQFLTLISELIRPQTIVEVGTFTGYSAICLAQGLSDGGILHTIEIDEEKQFIISEFVQKAQLQDKIKLHLGDAQAIIPTLPDGIDLSFIDADKESYDLYYELLLAKTPKGGFLLIDNVLWHGKVLNLQPDKKTALIQQFNQKVLNDVRVRRLLLPLRDGLLLVKKL